LVRFRLWLSLVAVVAETPMAVAVVLVVTAIAFLGKQRVVGEVLRQRSF